VTKELPNHDESTKAVTATVQLGDLSIDGYMMPNGEFRGRIAGAQYS
jgi:hypothetical protein